MLHAPRRRPRSQNQVEYAVKAVENGGTAVGIRCKDGVVLALGKLVTSKLLKAGANKRIATVDRNMGIVSSKKDSRAFDPSDVGIRSPQVSFPMAATSYPVHATRPRHGAISTRPRSPPPRSPTAWEATSRHILSILACDPLV